MRRSLCVSQSAFVFVAEAAEGKSLLSEVVRARTLGVLSCSYSFSSGPQNQPAHGTLNPLGFKIALELMVKCAPHKIVEVPYTFVDRV